MESHTSAHLVAMCVIGIVAIVSVSAMLMFSNGVGAAKANEKAKANTGGFGSYCTHDAQCDEDLSCIGTISLPNGNTIPGVKVCV